MPFMKLTPEEDAALVGPDVIARDIAQGRADAGLPPIIPRRDLTTIAMVNGKEAQHSVVVVDGRVRQWVGFGWIDVDDDYSPAARAGLPVAEA